MIDPNEVNKHLGTATYAVLVTDLLSDRKYEIKGHELSCCCPFHDEEHPSFGINLETGTFNCFSCGEKGSIVDFVAKRKNINNQEAWEFIKNETGIEYTPNTKPYTIEDFSQDKKLPIEFLKRFGIQTSADGNSVLFPYQDISNNFLRWRIRNHPDSACKFLWDNAQDVPTTLYGLWSLNSWNSDYIVIVEGESDTLTLWHYGIPAVGVPGASNFKKEYAKYFEKFKDIYVHSEEDTGANTLLKKVCEVLPISKLYKLTSKKVDSSCKDPSDLHIKGMFDKDKFFATAEPLAPSSKAPTNIQAETNGKAPHVIIGEQLIEILNLKYYNNNLYTYKNGVYILVDDKMLHNYILRNISESIKSNLRKESIDYVKMWLPNNETIDVDDNYINYKNGLFDINKEKFIPHTPDIFSVNQNHVNYIEDLQPNEVVDKYLLEVANGDPNRVETLLQQIGYTSTCKTDLQKSMIWYGPTASNGKSTFGRIMIEGIGEENTCSVELQQFEKRFGVNELDQKLLNMVPELSSNSIKDVSKFKAAVGGERIMADIKYQNRKSVKPYSKHIFTTNVLPQVEDTTDGYYRRLNILEFDNKFDVNNNKFDINVFFEQDNLDYLFNKGLRAYLKMYKSGSDFANAEESNKILEDYKASNDTVFSFLTDENYQDSIYGVDRGTRIMWEMYTDFCKENGLDRIKKCDFKPELLNKYKFTLKRIDSNYFYYRATPISLADREKFIKF